MQTLMRVKQSSCMLTLKCQTSGKSWQKTVLFFEVCLSPFNSNVICVCVCVSGLLNAKNSIDQTSNPFLDRIRSAFSSSSEERVESEEARVIRSFRMIDPSFTIDSWMRTATEFYIPDGIYYGLYLFNHPQSLTQSCDTISHP